MKSLIAIIVTTALVNNVVLSQFLGICSFLGVSSQKKASLSLGMAVTAVLTVSSLVAGMLYQYVLLPMHLEYLKTIVFILVIAALVQMVEMFLKKNAHAVYQSLGIYLPLLVVEPLLTYRQIHHSGAEAVHQCTGQQLFLQRFSVLPMAGMPAGGFIVLGVLCAVWRALAAKRRAYLTKEAGNLVDVHSQKEADREG